MNITVTKNQVTVDTDYILNDGEYNVNTCTFSFSDDYTDDLVKKAVFIQNDNTIEMSIINNACAIPYEVLNEGSFEIHVYAYEVDGEDLVLRLSPSYTTAYVRSGSFVENAEAPEEITPTQFEQYMQAMNDGLAEVQNVDIDAEQTANGGIVTITNRDGVEKTVTLTNGQDGEKGADGITPTIGNNGDWYIGDTDTGKPSRGEVGEPGQPGADGFSPIASVSKTGDTATITITDKTGTTTASVSDGKNGTNGINGTDGFSPIATVSKSGTTATISITDKTGTTTATVSDGTNGQDGVGVPTGGTQGQILAKASATNYDTTWIDAPSGGGDQKIYYFDLPSYIYWSSSGTTVKTSSQFTTTQAEQLQAMLDGGLQYAIVLLKFEPNYPFPVITYLDSYAKDNTVAVYKFVGLFEYSNGKTYGANFEIDTNPSSTVVNQFKITFAESNGFVKTSKIKTANNTTAGNVYDVTYINSSYLSKTNTTAFTPTSNYNPATKLYSDTTVLTQAGLSPYSSSSTYNEGDYVYYSDTDLTIYRCNTANTTGTWDSAKWVAKTYMEYLQDIIVNNALGGSY